MMVKIKDEDLRLAMQEAEEGVVDSQFMLALAYYTGEGVKRDYAKAAHWFAKAAEQDDFEALYRLGVCYENGHGVEKDPNKAFELYLQAALEGIPDAMAAVSQCYRSGIGVEKNAQEADYWAAHETKTNQYNFRNMEDGMEQIRNLLTGSEWFIKSLQATAKAGRPDAMTLLGVLHMEGRGVPHNPKKAIALLQKAADLQNAEAMYRLGICYERGAGVPQDMVQAYTWFRKAASFGHENALRFLSGLPSAEPSFPPS